jgi:hypothetical protein
VLPLDALLAALTSSLDGDFGVPVFAIRPSTFSAADALLRVIIFRTAGLAALSGSVAPRLLVHPVFPGLGLFSIRHDTTLLVPDFADHL